MSSSLSQVEYVSHTRIGEKGQLTIPKRYRDELGLATGSPVAVLRIGEGLMLIPEQNRFRILCESIASVLEHRQLSAADLRKPCPRHGKASSFAAILNLRGANAERGGASVIEPGGTCPGIPRLHVLTAGVVSTWGLDKAVLSLCAARICRLVLAEAVREEVEENLLLRLGGMESGDVNRVLEQPCPFDRFDEAGDGAVSG